MRQIAQPVPGPGTRSPNISTPYHVSASSVYFLDRSNSPGRSSGIRLRSALAMTTHPPMVLCSAMLSRYPSTSSIGPNPNRVPMPPSIGNGVFPLRMGERISSASVFVPVAIKPASLSPVYVLPVYSSVVHGMLDEF